MLIVLSGLPGTGKTTIAKALLASRPAAYVRVDEIEHALKQNLATAAIGTAGYGVAFAIASSNLKLGNMVVADSVNPVPESRMGWRAVAQDIKGARLLEVEIICSDLCEHKRRVEGRTSDIDRFDIPSWAAVMSHDYVTWTSNRLIVDTALLSAMDAVSLIEHELKIMSELPIKPDHS